MRELKPNPCLNCEERYIGCHGKNEDGTWRCKEYGKAYEKADADYRAYQSSAQAIVDQYKRDRGGSAKAKAAEKKRVRMLINKRRRG